jgi:hypothetical protein
MENVQEIESPSASDQNDAKDVNQFFLPESLVKIVAKIANFLELSSIDEFSILDTLQFAIGKNINSETIADEKGMSIFLLNVVRISKKFNSASSTKPQLEKLLADLEISSEEFHQQEFAVFKSMDFQIQTPVLAEQVYKFIEVFMKDFNRKEVIFAVALDILRIVYASRESIHKT